MLSRRGAVAIGLLHDSDLHLKSSKLLQLQMLQLFLHVLPK